MPISWFDCKCPLQAHGHRHGLCSGGGALRERPQKLLLVEVWAFCMGSRGHPVYHRGTFNSIYLPGTIMAAKNVRTHGGDHTPSDNDIPTGHSCDCLDAGSQRVADGILCGDFHLVS